MLYSKCKFAMCEKVVYTHKHTGNNLSADETKMAASSIEIVDFLKQIDYIPNDHIDVFLRNRKEKIELANANGLCRSMIICVILIFSGQEYGGKLDIGFISSFIDDSIESNIA